MWFLVATLLVSGHHYILHVEKFTMQTECEERIVYVKEMIETYAPGAIIVLTCETHT